MLPNQTENMTETTARKRGGQPGNDNAVGSPGPVGNDHNLKHGLKAFRATGLIPKQFPEVQAMADDVRELLESSTLAAHGKVEITHASLISTVDERLLADLSRLSVVERGFGLKIEAPRTADGHCDRAMALS